MKRAAMELGGHAPVNTVIAPSSSFDVIVAEATRLPFGLPPTPTRGRRRQRMQYPPR
jgi:hypothetical protein